MKSAAASPKAHYTGYCDDGDTAHVIRFPAHKISSDGSWIPEHASVMASPESSMITIDSRSMSSLVDARKDGDKSSCVCWCTSAEGVIAAFGMESGVVECLVWSGSSSGPVRVRLHERTLMSRLWRGIKSTVSIDTMAQNRVVAIAPIGHSGSLIALHCNGEAKTWSIADQRVVSSWNVVESERGLNGRCALFRSTPPRT